jgi:hypothetical protein
MGRVKEAISVSGRPTIDRTSRDVQRVVAVRKSF